MILTVIVTDTGFSRVLLAALTARPTGRRLERTEPSWAEAGLDCRAWGLGGALERAPTPLARVGIRFGAAPRSGLPASGLPVPGLPGFPLRVPELPVLGLSASASRPPRSGTPRFSALDFRDPETPFRVPDSALAVPGSGFPTTSPRLPPPAASAAFQPR